MPLWDDARCEAFLRERVQLHQRAREALPECSFEERWGKPEIYAVRKKGNRTALRLYTDRALAERHLAERPRELEIDVRPAEFPRCGYCSALPFCDQGLASRPKPDA